MVCFGAGFDFAPFIFLQDGRRPLTFAATNNRVPALQFLLENGADPNLPNRVSPLFSLLGFVLAHPLTLLPLHFYIRTDGQRCTSPLRKGIWRQQIPCLHFNEALQTSMSATPYVIFFWDCNNSPSFKHCLICCIFSGWRHSVDYCQYTGPHRAGGSATGASCYGGCCGQRM